MKKQNKINDGLVTDPRPDGNVLKNIMPENKYSTGGSIRVVKNNMSPNQQIEIVKKDFSVFIDTKNMDVSVDQIKSDTVDQIALSDTGVEWNQEHSFYGIHPKTIQQLKNVLTALRVNPVKVNQAVKLLREISGTTFDRGGMIKNQYAGGGTLGKDYVGVSVSHATLKEEHLIERFISFIEGVYNELSASQQKKFNEIKAEVNLLEREEDGDFVDAETAGYILNEDLFDLMNDIAPEGTYFGSSEGDGSDFGFWNSFDEYEEDEECGEEPDDDKKKDKLVKGGKLGYKKVADVTYRDGANYKTTWQMGIPIGKENEISVGDDVPTEFFGIPNDEWLNNYLVESDPEFDHNILEIDEIRDPRQGDTVVNFAEGGTIKHTYHGRYITLEEVQGGLRIRLNKEGKKEAKTADFSEEKFYEFFEDVAANSEYLYFMESPLGLTNAPVITDGYYYDDNGNFTHKGNENSKVWWYPDYFVKDFTEELKLTGETFFQSAPGQKYADGGKIKLPGLSAKKSDDCYFNSVNHFMFFLTNFPDDFFEAFPEHLRDHLRAKMQIKYEKYGALGSLFALYFELDKDNQRRLALWAKQHYKGERLY